MSFWSSHTAFYYWLISLKSGSGRDGRTTARLYHSIHPDNNNDKEESSDYNKDDKEKSDKVLSDEVENALHDLNKTKVAKLCQKGGACLIQYLISKAIPLDKRKKALPLNVCEWAFCNITRLLSSEQKEWFTTCCEELEALCKYDIYNLVNYLKG